MNTKVVKVLSPTPSGWSGSNFCDCKGVKCNTNQVTTINITTYSLGRRNASSGFELTLLTHLALSRTMCSLAHCLHSPTFPCSKTFSLAATTSPPSPMVASWDSLICKPSAWPIASTSLYGRFSPSWLIATTLSNSNSEMQTSLVFCLMYSTSLWVCRSFVSLTTSSPVAYPNPSLDLWFRICGSTIRTLGFRVPLRYLLPWPTCLKCGFI